MPRPGRFAASAMDAELVHCYPFVYQVPSPCYVSDLAALERNLAILDQVQERTGCVILLALKGFAQWSLFDRISRVLRGVSASSLDEARLGREKFGGEVHVYSPAYRDEEFPEMLGYADHLVFNSFSQWQRFQPRLSAGAGRVSCGIRVNPGYSEVKVDLYNPCGRHSRLGVVRDAFRPELLEGIEGLHFHALCEQNADALARTLAAFHKGFGAFMPDLQWLNLGGGHHITRPDYDLDLLCRLVEETASRYGVRVYLEPGEAVALGTGVLVAEVLDVVDNGMRIAILDTSAAAHMPDVLEMPYRPEVALAGRPGEHPYTYRLGGLTCLAGDVIGDYSFPEPLAVGQRLVFQDMAHYTMVKNTTFNGVRLPAIAIFDPAGDRLQVVRRFGYPDFRDRLS